MAALTFADLEKNLPKTSTPRWTVLVYKIKEKENFTIDKSNKEVKLNYLNNDIKGLFLKGNLKEIQTTYKGKVLFKGSNGVEYKLSDIFKSPDFGGGSGSGGGSDDTERNESAQCLYAALVFYVYKKEIPINKKISKNDFIKAFEYCDTSAKFEDLIDLPKDWHESSIYGANALYKKFKNKRFEFHRGSSIVSGDVSIENTFKTVNRIEKAFGNLNKWSPADMYCFTKKGIDLVRTEISKATTLQKLNSMMIKYYKSGDIVGVSLKKMAGTAKVSENNIGTDKINVQYTGVTVVAANKPDMFESIDVYINHSKGKIQFRNFGGESSLTGWQGEGKGVTANQGKISLGPINFILSQHGVNKLPESLVSARLAKTPNPAYFKEFYDASKKINVKGLPKTQKIFEARWKTKDNNWRYSKYLGILLIERVSKLTKKKKDELITDLFLYSASKASFAGPYMKLE
jgi:hypothetical protein